MGKKLVKRDAERFREMLRSVAVLAVESQNVPFHLGESDNEKLSEWLSDIADDVARAQAILERR